MVGFGVKVAYFFMFKCLTTVMRVPYCACYRLGPVVKPVRVPSYSHNDLMMLTLIISIGKTGNTEVRRDQTAWPQPHSQQVVKTEATRHGGHASSLSICAVKAEDPCEFEASLDDIACSRPDGASQLDLSLKIERESSNSSGGGEGTLQVRDRAGTLGLHHPDLSHQHSDLEWNR